MIEIMILGALMVKPMSGYEIKQLMSYTSDYFFKVSNGSLYPTLKNFEENGVVSSHEVVENGRCRIVYELTDDGREMFMEYMKKPLRPLVLKDEMLIRLCFAAYLPPDVVIGSIEQKLDLVKDLKDQLNSIKAEQEDINDVYRKAALQFGFELADLMHNFYYKLLLVLEEQSKH